MDSSGDDFLRGIENDVGTLELAKIAVVVKGEKFRLIHDMRRNGTNSKVTFEERIVCFPE